MNKKHIAILTLTILLFAVIGGAGSYFLLRPLFNQEKSLVDEFDEFFGWKYPTAKFPSVGPNTQIAYSDIRDPGGTPQGLPVRLKIPVIGVDSAIEDALITPDGRMDVPSGSVNVAWFALGPHPGKVGSAVIGGHFGIKNGVPFVFYKLDTLKIGDKVNIIDDEGEILTFVVRSTKLFDRNADATTVFTSDDGVAHLNLITCEGVWNQVNGTYPQRRVVFTDLVSAGNMTKSNSAFSRSLSIGAQGEDVVALQNALEKKGFLQMPRGISKGFFGSLTRVAVSKYQISVGLPSSGFFGPLTTAKLVEDLGGLPIFPDTAIVPDVVVPAGWSQTMIELVGSLYETPLDGITTSILLLSIASMVVAIIPQRKRARHQH